MIILFSPELLRPHSEGNPDKPNMSGLERGREAGNRSGNHAIQGTDRLIWMLENWEHFH